jgi:hypothetical protein
VDVLSAITTVDGAQVSKLEVSDAVLGLTLGQVAEVLPAMMTVEGAHVSSEELSDPGVNVLGG